MFDPFRAQVVADAAWSCGVDVAVVDQIVDDLQQQYPDGVPTDWVSVRDRLVSQSTLAVGQVDVVIDYFLASTAAESDLRRMLEPTPEWVAPGSRIYRVGTAFYLEDGHQVWEAEEVGYRYFHDGAIAYDTAGTPLTTGVSTVSVPEPSHAEVAAVAVEELRPILAAAIAAVPGAEDLTADEIRDVLARLVGVASH